jgi:hypothetical protein
MKAVPHCWKGCGQFAVETIWKGHVGGFGDTGIHDWALGYLAGRRFEEKDVVWLR